MGNTKSRPTGIPVVSSVEKHLDGENGASCQQTCQRTVMPADRSSSRENRTSNYITLCHYIIKSVCIRDA